MKATNTVAKTEPTRARRARARQRPGGLRPVAGWPLHPAGYALSGTFTMPWLWSATLLGWLVKALTLRYGGMRLYRFLFLFLVGLILGDYVAGALWAICGILIGQPTYRVAPI